MFALWTLVFVSLIASTGCVSEGMANHPTSQEEFKAAFENAYNANNANGMKKLIYSDGMPDEMIEYYTNSLTECAGRHQIESIEFTPFESDPRSSPMSEEPPFHIFDGQPRPVSLNLTPEYWIDIATVGNEGYQGSESSLDLAFPVGVHEGRYFFCGQVWADE